MKYAFAALALLSAGSAVAADLPKFGAGFVLGVPFGATAKYWIDKTDALQSHLGVSDGDFTMSLDYLRHFENALPRKKPGLRAPLYAGMGFKVKSERETFAGIRFVGGVSLIDSSKPFEVFAEIAPVLRFAPSEGGAFDGAVGIRRYF